MIIFIYVGLGGMAGAVLRHVISKTVNGKTGSLFPLGTVIVNITGAFVLSFLLGLYMHCRVLMGRGLEEGLTTGLLGAYTTFSTMTYESLQLIQDGELGRLAQYLSSTVVFGLGAAWLGLYIATKLIV